MRLFCRIAVWYHGSESLFIPKLFVDIVVVNWVAKHTRVSEVVITFSFIPAIAKSYPGNYVYKASS